MKIEGLTIRALRVRAVQVPLKRPIKTASGTIPSAPLVILDLLTEQGVTGSSYIFCYTPQALAPTAKIASNLEAMVKGAAVAPLEIDRALRSRFRLLGVQGLVAMAMAGLDMAAWDALAKAAEAPLVTLLGGAPQPIPAYDSQGMLDAKAAAGAAEAAAGEGFRAIKIKIGHPKVDDDLKVLRAARDAAGDKIALMVDYNQSLSVPEAIARARVLDGESLAWIEEPTLAEDFAGHAKIAQAARTPIQMGENWWGIPDMTKCLAAEASDLAMLDVMKIGGVTGWLRAAALAEAKGRPVSSHLFPEISAHLLAVTPSCHWLEYLDVAGEILHQPLVIENGEALIPEGPGSGVAWDEAAVERFLV